MTSKINFELKFAKSGDAAPQFVSRNSSDQQSGQFSVQMSLFMGKVYCHLQNNKKGTQTSFPMTAMHGLFEIREEIQAAADTLLNFAGPPSPPLIALPPAKKRRVFFKKKNGCRGF
ncbi:uncharacterized protein LOC125675260 [Ostrea edulis]|uniref:uncharacterized protein LOC125675260 n=1 Tax=Ostrea edulis TaxID=37623 RepID=UPI0024AFC3BF|nr:uncharacterized protein LOC125675260 [Ostrea edulis]